MKLEVPSWSRPVLVLELVVAILVGLTVLPWIFGDDSVIAAYASVPVRTGVWIGLALVFTVWLVMLSVRAARLLGESFSHLPLRRSREARARPEVLAALLVATVDIVLVNGILQSPLSAVLALRFSPATAESAVGAIAVILFLIVLVRLHFVARPYVEGSAWSALDIVVATTSTEGSANTVVANTATRAAPTRQPATRADTAAATLAATRPADAPTVAAPVLNREDDVATQNDPRSGHADPDATRIDTTN